MIIISMSYMMTKPPAEKNIVVNADTRTVTTYTSNVTVRTEKDFFGYTHTHIFHKYI